MNDVEPHTIQYDSEIHRRRETKIAQIKGYGSPLPVAPQLFLAIRSRYFVVISHNVLCARRMFQLFGHIAATQILLSENNVDNVRLKRQATSIEFEICEKSAGRLAGARWPILPILQLSWVRASH